MSLATAHGFAVAHYACDEASGSLLDDVNSHDGTETGTVASASGLFDGGRDFERGDTDKFDVADHADFEVADNDYTVGFLFFPESVDVDQNLVNKANGGGGAYLFGFTSTGKLKVRGFAASGFGSETNATSTASMTMSAWNLAIFKHDAAGNVLGISLNGGAFETASITGGLYASGSEGVQIGRDSFGNNADGILDDLFFLKGYAFTDQDAADLWNGGDVVPFADWDAGGGDPVVLRSRMSLLGVGR